MERREKIQELVYTPVDLSYSPISNKIIVLFLIKSVSLIEVYISFFVPCFGYKVGSWMKSLDMVVIFSIFA